MYRNIVLDLGDVVIDYKPKDFLADLFFHEKTEKKLYDITFGSTEWVALEKGEITWEYATKIFNKKSKEQNIHFEMQALLDEWENILKPKNGTIVLMRLLRKRRYRLFYLSNVSCQELEAIEKKSFWPLFNGGVSSCEAEALKPSPIIYEKLLSKYRLSPSETIYIDDKPENVQTAIDLGMAGIQFTDVKQLCRDLVDYNIHI